MPEIESNGLIDGFQLSAAHEEGFLADHEVKLLSLQSIAVMLRDLIAPGDDDISICIRRWKEPVRSDRPEFRVSVEVTP